MVSYRPITDAHQSSFACLQTIKNGPTVECAVRETQNKDRHSELVNFNPFITFLLLLDIAFPTLKYYW